MSDSATQDDIHVPVQENISALPSDVAVPVGRLDADIYNAEDLDGVTESLFGSGNLNYLTLQSRQTDAMMNGGGLTGEEKISDTGKAESDSGAAGGRLLAGIGDLNADLLTQGGAFGGRAADGTDISPVSLAATPNAATGLTAEAGPQPVLQAFMPSGAGAAADVPAPQDGADGNGADGRDGHDGGSGGGDVTTIVNNITNAAGDVTETVINAAGDTINNVTEIAGDAISTVTTILNDPVQTVTDIMNAPVEFVTNITDDLTQNITHAAGDTLGDITSIVNGPVQAIVDMADGPLQMVQDVTNIVNDITGGPAGQVVNMVTDLLQPSGTDVDFFVHNELGAQPLDVNLDAVENIVGDINIGFDVAHGDGGAALDAGIVLAGIPVADVQVPLDLPVDLPVAGGLADNLPGVGDLLQDPAGAVAGFAGGAVTDTLSDVQALASDPVGAAEDLAAQLTDVNGLAQYGLDLAGGLTVLPDAAPGADAGDIASSITQEAAGISDAAQAALGSLVPDAAAAGSGAPAADILPDLSSWPQIPLGDAGSSIGGLDVVHAASPLPDPGGTVSEGLGLVHLGGADHGAHHHAGGLFG